MPDRFDALQKLNGSVAVGSDAVGFSVDVDSANSHLVIGSEGTGGYAYVFQSDVDGVWSEVAKLRSSDYGLPYPYYSYSVGIDGGSIAVGAPWDDEFGTGRGAVYIHIGSGASWSEQQKLQASDAANDDHFGYSVAIKGDQCVVGAKDNGNGAAYPFSRSGVTWSEDTILLPGVAGEFGYRVDIDTNKIIVGAPSEAGGGSASIYEYSGSWSLITKVTPPSPYSGGAFGKDVAIEGDWAVVGAPENDYGATNAGIAFVYKKSGGTWSLFQALEHDEADSAFGYSVSISGDYIMVGAKDYGAGDAGAFFIYHYNGIEWGSEQKYEAADNDTNDYYGSAVAIDGRIALCGAPGDDASYTDDGSAYVNQQPAPETNAEKYRPILLDLYPPGAFPGEVDKYGNTTMHYDMVDADSLIIGAGQDACDQLALEIFPQTAEETLDEWEEFFELDRNTQHTTAQRQQVVHNRARAAQAMTPANFRSMLVDFLNPEYQFKDPCDNSSVSYRYDQSLLNNGHVQEVSAGLECYMSSTEQCGWDGSTFNAPVILYPIVDRDDDIYLEGKVQNYSSSTDSGGGLILYESTTSVYWWGPRDVSGTNRLRASKIEAGAFSDIGDVAIPGTPFWLQLSIVDGIASFKYGSELHALNELAQDESTIKPRYIGIFAVNDNPWPAANCRFQPLQYKQGKQENNVEILEPLRSHVPDDYEDAIFIGFVHRDPTDSGSYSLKEPQRIMNRVKYAHCVYTVGESDDFLTDDENSLTDRDVLGA